MELFQTLGAQVEQTWRDVNYDESVFPAIAAEALDAANLPGKVSAWEIIEWTLGQTVLPEQRDIRGSFGDPPITLYNSPRFHIDVYFWLEGTTAIHQHAFCGAFQVMHGSSIHSHYEFELRERINIFAELGEMNLKTVEYLEVGKVRQIAAGRQYIHGLFHLDQPSATIVVRTFRSPMNLPQFSYYKPSLAIDPFFEEPNATKKIQCLTALIRANHPDTDRHIGELLAESDFQTTFTILSKVRGFLQANQFEQMFNTGASEKRFDALLEIVKKRHGARAEVFPKVFEHQEKVGEIIKRRNFVKEPEHRFFLALLMNVEGKERILSLIKERFPEADPIEKILDWTLDLAQTRVLGVNIPNALGIADFGNLDLFILENMLKNKSDEEIRAALRAEYPAENLEALEQSLAEKTERIRQSIIFESLLQMA
ncbi:MAG: hypothetical protein M3R11_00350 [Acidobacteriota bacterium]|nr:hypothetical protein [Acidobacteriota bacterium]